MIMDSHRIACHILIAPHSMPGPSPASGLRNAGSRTADPKDDKIVRPLLDTTGAVRCEAAGGGAILVTTTTDVAAVVLAAGDSRRMGYPKALLPLGADRFLTRILNILKGLSLCETVVVLGTHESVIRPVLSGYAVRTLTNPDPARGQLSSLQIAFEAVGPTSGACLVWPVDHPCISAGLVADLIRRFRESGAALVLPDCAGKAGHPGVFGRNLMAEMVEAPPGATTKELVLRHRQEAVLVPTEERGTIEDIDTREDYERFFGISLESELARTKLP
jgi:molybdenum cofactor cytidylyltransferase